MIYSHVNIEPDWLDLTNVTEYQISPYIWTNLISVLRFGLHLSGGKWVKRNLI